MWLQYIYTRIPDSHQVCKFPEFSLISDFLTSSPLKIVFEILTLEYVSHSVII